MLAKWEENPYCYIRQRGAGQVWKVLPHIMPFPFYSEFAHNSSRSATSQLIDFCPIFVNSEYFKTHLSWTCTLIHMY